MGSDQHTATDLTGGCARELHRLSHLLTRYIDLERFFYGSASASRKETERLCRFSGCFGYGILLHVAGERRPAFVSPSLFDLAGMPAPALHESAKVFTDAFLINENSYAAGEYIRHFYWQPADNFISRLVLTGAVGQISLVSSSGTLRFLGSSGTPHSILSLFGSEELFATQDKLCHLNVITELDLIMGLSASQYAVYRLMHNLADNRILSEKLFCSAPTIKSHKAAIKKKMRAIPQKRRACWLLCRPFLAKSVAKG